MAVIAQTGVFSFGPQIGKGTVAATFYKHRASDVDLATISDDRIGPMEVGGDPTPTIPYRAGVMAAGGALINPRLENTLGWLLYGGLGAWAATQDQDVLGVTETGMYHHTFKFASDKSYVPYMSFRKHVPGITTTESMGEQFQDCKVIGMAFALPNDGLITSRVDVLGIAQGTNFDDNPAWTYGNTNYEDFQSIPIGSVTGGFIKIPSFSASELPITAATVTLGNTPLDIRQEKNYGSPYLDEVTPVGRQLGVDLIVKWKDPQLYLSILTGTTTGTQWSPMPFVSDLDVVSLSPDDAPAQAKPYGFRVTAPSVMYQVVGGLRLAGNQAVMMRLQGIGLASASDYCVFHLANKVTTYTWPT